ncbi:hypothetical protein BC629DRAFT_1503783 [Irpex lacteus]|nr:hypothetical protein BC629DRAFT_1503783 [Irpex lacteus]
MSDPERSTKSREKSIPVASPTPSLSPMLPPKMHFPIPPKSNPLGGAQIVPTLTDAFQSLSPTASSIATVSPHTATASDMSEGELSPSSSKGTRATPSRPPRPSSLIIPTANRSRANSANTISSTLTARSPPSSPSSPTPTYGRPAFPPSSRIRGASTSTNASVTGVGNRISTQHYSYSARSTNSTATAPSPTSPPPMSPLPSPPTSPTSFPRSASGSGGALSSGEEVEVEAGWSTDASTRLGHGGWSTDASTRVGSLGGSLANMKKAALLGATESRVRANTITTTAASTPTTNGVGGHSATRQRAGTSGGHPHPHYPTPASTYRQHASGVSSGEETNYESAASGRSILAGRKKTVHVLSSKANDSTESIVGRPRAASQSSTQRDLPPLPAASAGQHDSSESTTPTRDDSNSNVSSSGLRAAHETFVRIMQEKHAAEKAELLRRIERLEREARKREREIKGLRWLVMNPTGGGGTADHPSGGSIGQPYVALLALEEQLTAGRLRSGSKSSEFSAMSAGTASDTTRSRTSSGVDRSADPATFSSPADSTEEGLMELQSEINDFIAPTQAYTRGPPVNSQSRGSEDQSDPRRDSSGSRRRSNTLLPAGHGLGIVDADLPCIPSGSDMSLTTLGGATYGSIPSLCLSSTNSTSSMASSGISLATKASSTNAVRQSPEPAKERRVSRLLKRISTSSTSSLSSASTSYAASNIKMRTSPSIEQVLDRAEVRAPIPGEARMDEALKKLRRFGGEGK